MKINELLMSIHNKEFKLERDLQVKKYLPIEVKKTIAQAIIYECTSDEYGAIKMDSVQRYLSYVKYMITAHTNLEYIDENYDVLCSTEYGDTNLLNAIMECFGDDAKECSRILNLMVDDHMQEYSIESLISQFLYKMNASVDGFVQEINKKIKDIDMGSIIPDDVSKNQLSEFLRKYVK